MYLRKQVIAHHNKKYERKFSEQTLLSIEIISSLQKAMKPKNTENLMRRRCSLLLAIKTLFYRTSFNFYGSTISIFYFIYLQTAILGKKKKPNISFIFRIVMYDHISVLINIKNEILSQ